MFICLISFVQEIILKKIRYHYGLPTIVHVLFCMILFQNWGLTENREKMSTPKPRGKKIQLNLVIL